MSGKEQYYLMEEFKTNLIASQGPNVDAFEKEIAEFVGAGEAVAISSGTAAIHLALSLLDVTKGDTVFCSTLTFVASAIPILYQGAEPVFIDSEPDTWNMSPMALRKALNDAALKGKLPKAIIIVNLYGQSARMDELQLISNYYEIPIIEDAAESLGSTYKDKASGTLGEYGVYSFNSIITTSGGGMLLSDDAEAMQRLRFLATETREHAPYYQPSAIGFNYRMSNLLAGIGRVQLQELEKRVDARRRIFDRYYQVLSNLPGVDLTPELTGTKSNRWLTTLTIKENELGVSVKQLIESMNAANIEASRVWKPLHMQPLFQDVAYYPHDAGEHVAENLFHSGLCLPSGSNLTKNEQNRVINCFKDTINGVKENCYAITKNTRYK